ncbi:hypothetical protein EYF80_020830 [Liparis tanakae]|uniref:G-protein coupled receptors family 2 profile 1 domain-containing protein n=1 Tax=Liparis tanakae TaxID=230148 RepID=A0A4Z2HT42_9TELE|nr:hypothetical protein EYF80_020830 [Liparis tanakae]
MRRRGSCLLEVFAIVSLLLPSGALADLTCDALLMLSGNVSLQSLASWNRTVSGAAAEWSGPGLSCDASVDGIGTCWPRSGAGGMTRKLPGYCLYKPVLPTQVSPMDGRFLDEADTVMSFVNLVVHVVLFITHD